MKIYSIIMVLYILISAFLGTIVLSFALHLFEFNDLIFQLNEIYNNFNARVALAIGGSAFILISLLLAQMSSSRREREKTIAFNNPAGQVTITLFAVEDLIRKMALEFPQIKEIRPDVVATKKRGIQIKLRLILKSETNIPEFTAQLQETVKNRIQEIFGIDEQIMVKIHVAKILIPQEKPRKKIDEFDNPEQNIQIPYQRI
jgi:uncharacterized alkaline shock family protein YloU